MNVRLLYKNTKCFINHYWIKHRYSTQFTWTPMEQKQSECSSFWATIKIGIHTACSIYLKYFIDLFLLSVKRIILEDHCKRFPFSA